MRISDCSLDVCSSDLLATQLMSMLLLQLCESMQVNILFPFLVFMVEDFGYKGERLGLYAGAPASLLLLASSSCERKALTCNDLSAYEIGRASCRKRVCQ